MSHSSFVSIIASSVDFFFSQLHRESSSQYLAGNVCLFGLFSRYTCQKYFPKVFKPIDIISSDTNLGSDQNIIFRSCIYSVQMCLLTSEVRFRVKSSFNHNKLYLQF